MKPEKFTKKLIRKSQEIANNALAFTKDKSFDKLTKEYNFNGYKRIYLVHIRKTGGTSLNNMFLSLSGEDPSQLYTQLAQSSDHCLNRNGFVYVGWNLRTINKGNYFYAFSHIPFHELSLPDKTFTVACFRDPVKRVMSHYNMLMDFYLNEVDHPCMETEGKWLGKDFNDFLSNIPRQHLQNQLYMFSPNFDINEAVNNVQKLDNFFYSSDFNQGIDKINQKTGLNLKAIHIRKSGYQAQIADRTLQTLRERLHDEYLFLDRIKEL